MFFRIKRFKKTTIIKSFKKIIFSWSRWDEMSGKQRKALSFGLFGIYYNTIYWGRGRFYGMEL